jgi:hypothetical protein
MSANHFVKIVRFGLIGESQDGDSYRHILFQDIRNNKKAELLLYKSKKPELWADIEHMEQGKNFPPYKGYVTRFNGIDIVVLGDESLEEAFAMQRWKLDLQKKISRHEAEQKRKESKGYITNLTHPGALEISWREIDPEAKLIRFRYYEGDGKYSLSKWHEITD